MRGETPIIAAAIEAEANAVGPSSQIKQEEQIAPTSNVSENMFVATTATATSTVDPSLSATTTTTLGQFDDATAAAAAAAVAASKSIDAAAILPAAEAAAAAAATTTQIVTTSQTEQDVNNAAAVAAEAALAAAAPDASSAIATAAAVAAAAATTAVSSASTTAVVVEAATTASSSPQLPAAALSPVSDIPPENPAPRQTTAEGHIIPHDHDVLSGRGASVNAHAGNARFRALCFAKKPDFDKANHAAKRRIATEIVQVITSLEPPGRFLKRKWDVTPKRGKIPVEGCGLPSKGPWLELGMERAILKTCQVMRDYKRPDRLMLRTQGRKRQRTSDEAGVMGNNNNNNNGTATAQQVVVPNVNPVVSINDKDIIASGIIPNENDVLSGRGAFVNNHSGNSKFRVLALERKSAFDAGSYADKRALAAEIVRIIRSLAPAGRFLKRASAPTDGAGKAIWGGLPFPRGLQGPWEELSDEQAVHKACQVMRDLRRPDRIDRDSSGFLVPLNDSPPPAPAVAALPLQTQQQNQPTTSTTQQQRQPLAETASVVPHQTEADVANAAIAAAEAVVANVVDAHPQPSTIVMQLGGGATTEVQPQPTHAKSDVAGSHSVQPTPTTTDPSLNQPQLVVTGAITNMDEASLVQHVQSNHQTPNAHHLNLQSPSVATPVVHVDQAQQPVSTMEAPSALLTPVIDDSQMSVPLLETPTIPGHTPTPEFVPAPVSTPAATEAPPEGQPINPSSTLLQQSGSTLAISTEPHPSTTQTTILSHERAVEVDNATAASVAAAEAAVDAIGATFNSSLPLATMTPAPAQTQINEKTAVETSTESKELEVATAEV